MKKLRLTRDTVAPVLAGHPWVYRDGVQGSAAVGELVELTEGLKPIALGLWEGSDIAVRVLGPAGVELATLMRQRIERAERLRSRVVGGDTDTFRLLNGEGDGLPGLVVDRYGSLAVVRVYSKAWEPHLGLLVAELARLSWVKSVFRRFGVERVDGRDGGQALHGPAPAEVVEVREHGLRLIARPWTGQKTGLFLDQRENRRRVGELSGGRTVLNLFGYNGGFSIYAARGGARRVVTVDMSAPALEDAQEIFRLNGFDPGQHGFEKADVFEYKGSKAELVICDPPSLTHGQASDHAARRAYTKLAAKVGPLVAPEGLLASASCTARLDGPTWEKAVREGLGRGWVLLERAEAGPDHPVNLAHPEGRYLKFALLARS